MRIVFVNLHTDWMLVKPSSVFIFKFSAAVKHKYLLDYLLNHPEYEVCSYINDRGFSILTKGNETFLKFLNLFKYLEHKIILKKNGIDPKKITVIKRLEDIRPDAVKIGMLSTPECMQSVAEKLTEYKPQNVVIDPVMYAKNGCALMQPYAIDTLIKTIIPLADVLTPNIPEAEKIAGMEIKTVADMEAAAKKICAMGCKGIVVKGGHHIGNAVDVLFDGKEFYHFETERINTKNTHGTGCTFSSAIAANLANGLSVAEAVKNAKSYVTKAIEHSLAIGKGCGPTHHFVDLYRKAGILE